MRAKHSESLIVVWRIAEFEAKQLRASAIEPVHLLIGLCKIVDVDLPELISKNTLDRDEILEESLRETRRLRTVFRVAGVNAKILRRNLRRIFVREQSDVRNPKPLRRSSASKEIFGDAEHFAEGTNQVVYPVHLLYAILFSDDKDRDAVFADLDINKKRLLNVAKREVFAFQMQAISPSKAARARRN